MFFKKSIDNEAFNRLVICTVGECIRDTNRQPAEEEFYAKLEHNLKKENAKLNDDQKRAILCIAIPICRMGLGEEIIPEYKNFFAEYPNNKTSYNRIFEIMSRHALLRDENSEVWKMMKKMGMT